MFYDFILIIIRKTKNFLIYKYISFEKGMLSFFVQSSFYADFLDKEESAAYSIKVFYLF